MASVVGLLNPGEMGAAIGAVLRQRGIDVLWASEGRSEATAARADAAGLTDAGTVAELARRS
jgi:3-hydroxyisobutyrate dehydrogenase-like beta-hydroxyacid dehydrogenase